MTKALGKKYHITEFWKVYDLSTISEIANRVPMTKQELRDIGGINQFKADTYGDATVQAIMDSLEPEAKSRLQDHFVFKHDNKALSQGLLVSPEVKRRRKQSV